MSLNLIAWSVLECGSVSLGLGTQYGDLVALAFVL